MKKVSIIYFLISIFSSLSYVWAKPGDADRFLSFGAGARAMGFGNAYTAVAGDSTSLYWNPSGLAMVRRREISALHATLYHGSSYDYLGYAYPLIKQGILGFELARFAGGAAEKRDVNNNLLGDFNNVQTLYGLGFGARYGRINTGVRLKIVDRRLDKYSSNLYGVDAGSQMELCRFGARVVRAGMVLQNLLNFKSGDTDDTLPRKIRLGFAAEIIAGTMLSFDIENFKGYFIGTEYVLGAGSLRLGWKSEGLSVGGGINYKDFQLDYAMLSNNELGWSQRFSLGYKFGPIVPLSVPAVSVPAPTIAVPIVPVVPVVPVTPVVPEKYVPVNVPQTTVIPEKKPSNNSSNISSGNSSVIVQHKLTQVLLEFKESRFSEAVKLCKEIIQIAPQNVTAYKRLGSAYYALHDYESARKAWEKALQLESNPREKAQIRKFLQIVPQ